MSKDTKMEPQDNCMSLPNLLNLLRDVLSQNPNRDKNFLKNELKIKPLIEVSKHSFDDACSPLAMIDFNVLQGAYQHYLENPDCLKQETAVPSSSDKNRWKDRVFISRRDSGTGGTSEDSDLERALCELPMTEIINNISPEFLDSCNKDFGRSSLFTKSVPVTELSPSVSFSPFQNTDVVSKSQDILENVRLSEVFDLRHVEEKDQIEISTDVRRKKTQFGKRKKCKRKIVLERNVNSTDSSEMLSPPSEIHVNELENLEKDIPDTEELNENGLSTQEQIIDSTVLISPANVSSSKNKKELRKSPKGKVESTKKGKVLTQNSNEISIMPNPTKPLQTLKNQPDDGKNKCEVLQSSEILLSGPQTVFQTSERQAEKPSTIPKAVLQNQSPTISSQAVDSEKTICEIGQETPKLSSARTKMVDKRSSRTHKAKSPKSKSNSIEDIKQNPSEVVDKLLNGSKTFKAKSPKSRSNSKEDTRQKPSDVPGKLLNSSQTLKAKSPKPRSNSKEGTCQKPSKVGDELLNGSPTLKAKSPKLRSNSKEDTRQKPSDVPGKLLNSSQTLKAKSPKSISNSKEDIKQKSSEVVDKLLNDSQTLKAKSPKSRSNSKEDTHKNPSDVPGKLLNGSQTLKAKRPKPRSNSKEGTRQKPSKVGDELLNGSQTLKAKSPKSIYNSKVDTHKKPSDKLLNSSQALEDESLKSISNFKEGTQKPFEVSSGQIFKSKSPRSISNPQENRSQISWDTVKGSRSLQTDAVKCNTYGIEKECADIFENSHITRNLSDSGFTESDKDGDKNSNISISPLEDYDCDAEVSSFFNKDTESQTSLHPGSGQEVIVNSMVDNHKIVSPKGEPPKLNLNSLPVTSNVDDNDDLHGLLDFEYDISEPEEMAPISPEDEPDSCSEDIHSTEEQSLYSEVTAGDTPGQEMCPTSDIISHPLAENVSCLTNQQEKNYNEAFGDPTQKEIGVAWNPPKAKILTKRKRTFSDDDDSSASDSETSYKRRKDSSPSQPQLRKEIIGSSSRPKLDVPTSRLRNLNSVIQDIGISCDNHNILKAVKSATEYLNISDRSTCLKIFQEIFLGIRDSVCLTRNDPEEPLVEIVEKLKSFVDNSNLENREEDIKLCSMVIYEFFQVPSLIRYALDLCNYLQTKAVPIRNRAVDAYATNAISRTAPENIILNFLTYVKKICRLPVHQPLLKHVLQRVVRGKECYMLPEFSQLTEFLCLLDDYEMERLPLQGLMKTCIENNCWDVFSLLFFAWCNKNCFPTPFLEALQSKWDEIGIWFKKFAAHNFGAGEPSESTKYFFGIIGVTLIMNICEIGRKKDRRTKLKYLANANEVLHTLHKYNVDILCVMESFFRVYLPNDPDPCHILCLPYSVFFNLVDICLRLNLPKNALQLYENYSSYLNQLPQALSDVKKSSIRVMQFEQFTTVTQSLHLKDPLGSGLSAFHHLMQLSKHEDILNEIQTSQRIKVRAIERIFANLLVTCLNKALTSTLNDLVQYILCCQYSPWEPFLMPKKEVLRGLVVTLAKCDKIPEARMLFNFGYAKNFYQIANKTSMPWELTVLSSWTNQEMTFVIEKYLNSLLTSLPQEKKSTIKFESFYAVKILIKDVPCPPPKISCLIVPTIPTPLSRACSVITSINPNLEFTEHENFILIKGDTVYYNWLTVNPKKSPDGSTERSPETSSKESPEASQKESSKNNFKLQEKSFKETSQSKPSIFGMNFDNKADSNLSRKPGTPTQSPNQASSQQKSTPSHHHERPSNDQSPSQNSFLHPNAIIKRTALFSSSERSSSNTSTVDRESSRPDLKRNTFSSPKRYASNTPSVDRESFRHGLTRKGLFTSSERSASNIPSVDQESFRTDLTRTASFSSSDRSASNTPQGRTSVDRESFRHDLKRPFEQRQSSCESETVDNESPSPKGPASKLRRIDSGDMSQLKNFHCRKVFPIKTPPQQQYPVSSLSKNNSLIQSQTIAANHLTSPQTGHNQFDVNASHQSSPQTGRNQFAASKPSNYGYSRTSPRQTSQSSTASSYQNTGLDQSKNATLPLPASEERFRSPVRQDRNRNNFVDSHAGSNFTVEILQPQQNAELDRHQSQSSYSKSHVKMRSPKRQINKLENFRVTQPAQFDASDTSPNDSLRQYKNISSRPPFLMSPPNHFALASPYPSDESELSLNRVARNLNVDIDSCHIKSTASIVTAEFKSPPKPKVARNLVISKAQNSETYDDCIASQKNNTFIPLPSSSKDHHPEKSSKSNPMPAPLPQKKTNNSKAKKISSYKEPATPKSKQTKPYRIPTPCHDVRVKRAFTPVCNKPAFRSNPVVVSIQNNSSKRTVAAPINAVHVPSVPPHVFELIKKYIETHIRRWEQYNSLKDEEKQEKAMALAKAFVEENSVTEVNKVTRRLLFNKFGNTNK
ncbi:hypothetical protein JTE90_013877 [Oedothorax gibbosus]|uniref:Uncharacterized protein n=1 Tax=Oedothorax gibbosus TaxID=931172 RepID=A0AAV6VF36_9ARAC|nr:hypothetical protein JTE90_013877 [Oedothorax gibbosus]